MQFEIADPSSDYDLVVLSASADIGEWRRYDRGKARVIFELIDSYMAPSRWDPRSMMRGAAKFASRQTRSLFLDYRRAIEEMLGRADAVGSLTGS